MQKDASVWSKLELHEVLSAFPDPNHELTLIKFHANCEIGNGLTNVCLKDLGDLNPSSGMPSSSRNTPPDGFGPHSTRAAG